MWTQYVWNLSSFTDFCIFIWLLYNTVYLFIRFVFFLYERKNKKYMKNSELSTVSTNQFQLLFLSLHPSECGVFSLIFRCLFIASRLYSAYVSPCISFCLCAWILSHTSLHLFTKRGHKCDLIIIQNCCSI